MIDTATDSVVATIPLPGDVTPLMGLGANLDETQIYVGSTPDLVFAENNVSPPRRLSIVAVATDTLVGIACHGKAIGSGVAVDPECLAKADAGLQKDFLEYESECLGTAADVGPAVDACVTTLLGDVPADGPCAAASVKSLAKGGNGFMGCLANDAKKPGKLYACGLKRNDQLAGTQPVRDVVSRCRWRTGSRGAARFSARSSSRSRSPPRPSF